ncbi:MAG TPA: fumarylacetoacetate hydrolase family protein [Planctomycetaceae bacterium]|nr:fumarylacetoacetate hydrolase family protein [Planctomycetaceae bacterium]
MKLCKVRTPGGQLGVALWDEYAIQLLDLSEVDKVHKLSDILFHPDPIALTKYLVSPDMTLPLPDLKVLAPIDRQEVWAAGVTYKRSQVARMEESKAGASHYDKVYTAPRPEIFFKATASRVSGPWQPLRVRADSRWSVPEPELALVISPQKKLVGFSIGNDMSARDIEGENPLYLPQAKVYNQCCGLGPCVLIPEEPFDREKTAIRLSIDRGGKPVFQGETHLRQMKRNYEELIEWLTRENDIPHGAFLLTGTGIVPPDDFTLENGDVVSIEIEGIGTLTNPIVKGA